MSQACGDNVPNFRYRALTQGGEIVEGAISAPTLAEVVRRIEYLQLLPIETVEDRRAATGGGLLGRPSAAEITAFTRDLALLLMAGARIDDGLELLARDSDMGRLRPVVSKLHAAIFTGKSFADAVSDHPELFPPIYCALVRAGEVSGTLEQVLGAVGAERARSEQMRGKLTEAMQYPAFVLFAAIGVMLFFILFVLPQFATVLGDLGTRSDTTLGTFISLSNFLRANATAAMVITIAIIAAGWWLLRQRAVRRTMVSGLARLPALKGMFQLYRTGLFCRNLSVLLQSGVNLTATLRILVDILAATGDERGWTAAADRVRHGGKLSDALGLASCLPPMAVRMLRLGEETGQLPALAARIAEFYEAKLQRSLDRVAAVVGPLSIIAISTVVGGLIVSVMTALLSVTQLVQ